MHAGEREKTAGLLCARTNWIAFEQLVKVLSRTMLRLPPPISTPTSQSSNVLLTLIGDPFVISENEPDATDGLHSSYMSQPEIKSSRYTACSVDMIVCVSAASGLASEVRMCRKMLCSITFPRLIQA